MDPYPLTPYFNPVAISFSISLHLTICLCKGIYLGGAGKGARLAWMEFSRLLSRESNYVT